jgi:putative ATPase
MLAGGEDPRYLARRLVRMAVEDIGLADPNALIQARAAGETFEQLGSPEGELALAQAAIYLALAPKSNAGYQAFKAASAAAREHGSLPPPLHVRNAPTKLLRQLGYGRGYAYDHDAPDRFSGADYFPEGMARATFYAPAGDGFEAELKARGERLAELRRARGGAP